MTAKAWANLADRFDPSGYDDGVLYLPDMLEVQPKQLHWGYPDQPRLRDRVANDRPHGGGPNGQKLLCLLCMRLRAERALPQEPIWLTLAERPYGPRFEHRGEGTVHAEHEPETDAHKALKERHARTWQAAGADVDVEEWRPRARRRPDVIARTPQRIVVGEIQHSAESPRTIQARQRSMRRYGDHPVWTTDRSENSIGFLYRVPHLAVPAMSDYRGYLDKSELAITAGIMQLEEQRCGWADLWRGNRTRCPVTGQLRPCGKRHLYPAANIAIYTHRPTSGPIMQFGMGNRPHLDYLLEAVLHDLWRPYLPLATKRVVWIPSELYEQVVAERGGSAEQAESGVVHRRDKPATRTCERRWMTPEIPAGTPTDAVLSVATGVCCGKGGLWATVGGPALSPACQLCPSSPTYWRRAT